MDRILVTGSRDFNDYGLFSESIMNWMGKRFHTSDFIVVHGGASGLDSIATEWANANGFFTEAHPADWNKHGKAAGPIRNQQMVDLGAEVCLAFPRGESRGTRDCMRRARTAGIEVLEF